MHNIGDINIKNFSKVEGRANLYIKITGDKVEKVEFQIAEYKRFYTWAIQGKNINSLPQVVSRICGTCSIAHLICAIEAIEHALGVEASEQTKILLIVAEVPGTSFTISNIFVCSLAMHMAFKFPNSGARGRQSCATRLSRPQPPSRSAFRP